MILRFTLAIALIFGIGFAHQMQMFQSVDPEQATLVGSGKEREYCPNCGMNLVKFHKTNHVHKDKQYCSIHCMYESTKGQIPTEAKVMDTKNIKFIDALKAFYVVGSSVKGTMTMNSKYAFENESDAKAFQAKNGGEILNFEQAYAAAGRDFEADNKMLKTKRESGAYPKGKEIYESRCQKVNVKDFDSIALLKANLKTVCKESNDGDLQAVALYLWDAPSIIKSEVKKTKPEKIVVPEGARCPICGMFVAKNPQWAAMIDDGAEGLYFDGVKDMMKYYFKNNKKFDKMFVSDYYKLHKTDARSAFYVIGSDVYGPMGEELIPFASEAQAQTFAKDHAGKRILKFDEIDESIIKGL